jgi:TetR/AcrR family transcriptional regulator, cholesterol catabolism regulator
LQEDHVALAEKTTRTPRRTELVAAAARLFSERGYHGTSMQDLGDALGIQRGSLYAHIGSKEELLLDVVEDGADRFLERGAKALSAPGGAADRLRALLVGHVETATRHLEASTVFLNEWRYLSPELREHIQGKRDRYEAMVREIVEDGIASGEFRADADVRFAATLVLSAGNWTYTWYRPGGDLTPTQIGERFAELVTKGLEART